MTANIARKGCRWECRTTWHVDAGQASPNPTKGTWGVPGDVRRCEHGHLWLWSDSPNLLDYWTRLYLLLEPVTYLRALRALDGDS